MPFLHARRPAGRTLATVPLHLPWRHIHDFRLGRSDASQGVKRHRNRLRLPFGLKAQRR
jgi:hypothetical protein